MATPNRSGSNSAANPPQGCPREGARQILGTSHRDVDAEAGIRWWNALTEPQRAAAFAAAQTAVPAEAWAHAKRAVLGETGPRVAKVPAIPAVEHRVDVCSRNRDVYPLNGRHRGAGHFCGTTLRTWLGAASLDQDRFESAAGALPVLFGLFDAFGLRADVAAASRPGAAS